MTYFYDFLTQSMIKNMMICNKAVSTRRCKESNLTAGAKFEDDFGEILVLGAEISPYK